ncbi:MAG: hypothetical protein ACREQY_08995 [Candidatus Binatia bacterium]
MLLLVFFVPLLFQYSGASRPFLPPTVEIEAYLDHAPEGVTPADAIEIRSGERSRTLVVVDARLVGGYPVRLERGLLDYRLIGPRNEVERVIGAEPGARIHGVFAYYGAGKRLLVVSLD